MPHLSAGRPTRPLTVGIEFGLVLLVLAVTYGSALLRVPFHMDEADWIATSDSFEALVRGDLDSPLWDDGYWTRVQPPLARYFIGLGRTIGGYGPESLNKPWKLNLSEAENAAAGNMPSPDLLFWSRLPMAVLTTASGLALFGLIRASAGPLAGYLFIALFTLNPFFRTHLVTAMSESSLLACIVLAACLGALALRARTRPAQITWLVGMGVASGMAGAAKLNGLVLAMAAILLAMALMLRDEAQASRAARFGRLLAICALIIFATGATFVLTNPYLYTDTANRVGLQLIQRMGEMGVQERAFASDKIEGWQGHLLLKPRLILGDYNVSGGTPGLWVVNLALTVVGGAFFAGAVWHWQRGTAGATSLALLLVVGCAAAPMLTSVLNWDRYFLLPVLFVSILAAAGAAELIGSGWARWRRRRQGGVASEGMLR